MQHRAIHADAERVANPYKLVYGENTPPNFDRCAVEIKDKYTSERRQCRGERGFGQGGYYCRRHRYPESRK